MRFCVSSTLGWLAPSKPTSPNGILKNLAISSFVNFFNSANFLSNALWELLKSSSKPCGKIKGFCCSFSLTCPANSVTAHLVIILLAFLIQGENYPFPKIY